MKKLLLIPFILQSVSTPVFADRSDISASGPAASDENKNCEYGNMGVVKSTNPSTTPNYFFRTFNHDGKEYVSYAGNFNKLHLLDLESGKELSFDGPYDPVPVGSDLISVPAGTYNGDTMKFYSVDDIVKGNTAPSKMAIDNESMLGGVYQSVGQVAGTKDLKKFRLITDQRNATLAEYEVSEGKPGKIRMVREPRVLCSNVSFKLPMISKDGSVLSAYDESSKTTKVWKINSQNQCEEILDLGVGVGKADFSYDNKKLTFHTTSAPSPAHYFESPQGSSMNMNVYVYDMEKKSLTKMTQNEAQNNSYYPVFRPDDTIVYSQINAGSKPAFVHADPKKVPGVAYDPKDVQGEKAKKLYLVGSIWARKCLQKFSSYSTAVTTALNLDPEKCRDLVDRHWDEVRNQMPTTTRIDYSTEELKSVCPTTKTTTTAVSGEKNKEAEKVSEMDVKKNSRNPTGESVLATKCSICHEHFSMSNLQAHKVDKQLAEKILSRINAPPPMRMPMTGTLSPNEKEALEKYVKSL